MFKAHCLFTSINGKLYIPVQSLELFVFIEYDYTKDIDGQSMYNINYVIGIVLKRQYKNMNKQTDVSSVTSKADQHII